MILLNKPDDCILFRKLICCWTEFSGAEDLALLYSTTGFA